MANWHMANWHMANDKVSKILGTFQTKTDKILNFFLVIDAQFEKIINLRHYLKTNVK